MKTLKKLGSLVLAICLCFSLCNVSAFAASSDDTEGSITISGAIANEEYTIYQIFELTYSDDNTYTGDSSSYSYKVNDAWQDFIEEYEVVVNGVPTNLFTLTSEGYLSVDSLIYSYENDDEVVAAFARAALAYAQDESNGITGSTVSFGWSDLYDDYVVTVIPENSVIASVLGASTDENGYVIGDLTISELNLGWYLVGTTLGSLCILDSTDPDATVNEKNGTPTISKYVHENSDPDDVWSETDDDYNGQLIKYEIEVDNINGAVNLVIHDAMDEELSIPANVDGSVNYDAFELSVTLYTSATATGVSLSECTYDETTGEQNGDGEYYLTVGVCTNENCEFGESCSFEIHFLRSFDDVDSTGYIEMTYDLLLDTEGDEYENDEEEIDNYAQVTFGVYSASAVVEAETFTFGFEVFKYTDAATDGVNVIVVPVYNDSPAGQQDDLYLALVGEVNGVETVTYFAIFDEVEGVDNSYYILEWIDESRIYYIQDEPYAILGYTDENGNDMGELPTVTEPDESVTEDDPINLIFYYDGTMPEHEYIVLDEFSTASMEMDQANEYVYGYVSSALAGAVFSLTNVEGQFAYFEDETIDLTDANGDSTGLTKHIYLFEGWISEGETVPAGYTTELVSDTTGYINIEGLDEGDYILTETAAPDGYNLMDGSISVTITAIYDEETGALLTHTVSYTYGDDTGTGVVEVLNNSGAILPSTGGMGTTIFYVIGAVLVCGAAVLLITRRRMSRAA